MFRRLRGEAVPFIGAALAVLAIAGSVFYILLGPETEEKPSTPALPLIADGPSVPAYAFDYCSEPCQRSFKVRPGNKLREWQSPEKLNPDNSISLILKVKGTPLSLKKSVYGCGGLYGGQGVTVYLVACAFEENKPVRVRISARNTNSKPVRISIEYTTQQ